MVVARLATARCGDVCALNSNSGSALDQKINADGAWHLNLEDLGQKPREFQLAVDATLGEDTPDVIACGIQRHASASSRGL